MKNYILFEIDLGITLPNTAGEWIKHSPNLYKITYSWFVETRTFSYGLGAWGFGAYGSSGEFELPGPERPPILKAESFIVDAISYTKVNSISEAEELDNSFYFDIETQILYVNFDGLTKPTDYIDISLGATKGFSKFYTRVDGIEYAARLNNIPNISISRDALFYGKVSFDGGTITLNNTDHYFDTFDQEDIYGKICRIRYSSDDTTYKTVFTGKLDDFQLSGDECILNIRDQRKNLLTEASYTVFDAETYPNLSEDNLGTMIPVGWGTVKSSPAYCIDETIDEKSTYTFKFFDTNIDTPTSLDKVRVDGKVVSTNSVDLSTGTFTLGGYSGGAYTKYEPGAEVEVDYTGINTTNPLDVIVELLDTYLGIEFNSNLFNTTNWNTVKVGLPDIGLGLVEPESVIDIINRIAKSIFGSFIVDGDGRYNFKVVDNTKEPVLEIKEYDLIGMPSPDYKGDEYISKCGVNYLTGIVSEKGPEYINTEKDTQLFIKYDYRQTQTFDTLLTTREDTINYSNTIMDNFGGIFPTWTFSTKTQTIDLELEDLIDCYFYEYNGSVYRVRLEVLGKDVNYMTGDTTIIGRFVSYPDGNPPVGSKIIRR